MGLTTTTTTEAIGCCFNGDDCKANDKGSRATHGARCEDMGCEFLVTDDPDNCIMTTISTPSTTGEVSWYYGKGVMEYAEAKSNMNDLMIVFDFYFECVVFQTRTICFYVFLKTLRAQVGNVHK